MSDDHGGAGGETSSDAGLLLAAQMAVDAAGLGGRVRKATALSDERLSLTNQVAFLEIDDGDQAVVRFTNPALVRWSRLRMLLRLRH